MDINNTNINERLIKLFSYDVRFILDNKELSNEYVNLHSLIEGKKPSCTGCSAKRKLREWKKRYSKTLGIVEIKTKKLKMTNNTFKLKKGRKSLRIPFTSKVITENSTDELVTYYLESATTEQDKERRLSFFEVLPTVKEVVEDKPKRKRRSKAEIQAEKDEKEIADLIEQEENETE